MNNVLPMNIVIPVVVIVIILGVIFQIARMRITNNLNSKRSLKDATDEGLQKLDRDFEKATKALDRALNQQARLKDSATTEERDAAQNKVTAARGKLETIQRRKENAEARYGME